MTNANITFDEYGRITAATNGSGTVALLDFKFDGSSTEYDARLECGQSTGIDGGASMYLSADAGFTCSGAITEMSDIRLKTNILKIDDALAKVQRLSGYTFDRIDIKCPRQTGVLAQEVLEVLPEAVLGSDDTAYSVAYGNMVGLLIEAIKEQQAQITVLTQQVTQLINHSQ